MFPGLTPAELTRAIPSLSGVLDVRGAEGPIAIWRDPEGIPHVRATSTWDAFFGQGLVQAQDRLWQMEYDRRRAAGRLAEYLGPAGLANDVQMRRLRLIESAQLDYGRLDAETRAMLDAFAAGVNAFLDATRVLPVEFQLLGARPEPWRPWDSLAIFKVRHVDMGSWQIKLWRARLVRQLGAERAGALCPGTQANPVLVVPPGLVAAGQWPDAGSIFADAGAWLSDGPWEQGSNNWALSGARTASGKPLIAGDPHRPLDVPSVYYQNHVAGPDFDVIGLSFAGIPGFPHFGHSARVAWCVTHGMADYQDLFLERFDREGRYEHRGEWRQAERARERIEVRGASAVEIETWQTHHGPVLLGDPRQEYAVALRYTATAGPNRTFEAFVPMMRASSAEAFDEAMRPWVDPVNNLVFGDVDGRLGYRTRGQVPVRDAANAWLPVPGWTGAHEWRGMVPFEAMPSFRDPAAGFIASANSRIAGPDYPHCLGLDVAPDFRMRRLTERLAPLEGATVADMVDILGDRLSIPAREFAGVLRAAFPEGAPPSPSGALSLVQAWDGRMERDSPAALAYASIRERLVRDLLTPILGPLATEGFRGTPRGGPAHVSRIKALLTEMIRRDDRILLPDGKTWPDVLRDAVVAADRDLAAAFGPDPRAWTWGRAHATQPQHPLAAVFPAAAAVLNPPAVALGGDGDTVFSAGFFPAMGFGITLTSVARYVFDLADWSGSRWVVPFGASGHPGSPHHHDQLSHWAADRLLPMRYHWAEIERGAESHQRLVPSRATTPVTTGPR